MEFISQEIASNDFRKAGAASRALKDRLKRIGADPEAIRRAMIAAYEAEMNVVIHSVGGRLEASLSDSQVEVTVADDGPGIPDIEQAMTEGFSTASPEARALGFGAGMGLPNIKRSSDRFRITSRVDEGTRVDFTIFLRPASTGGARLISLYASPDRCRDCRACLRVCPTQAIRVRSGLPSILEHLCIDCTQCIGACGPEALRVRGEISSLEDLAEKQELVLVVPPALLAGCGPEYTPAQVHAALKHLGFAEVVISAPFEEAVRQASFSTRGEQTPTIIPVCPAVINLIELKFPSLLSHLAPFDSPWEAVQAVYGNQPAAYVVSCPSQRSALLALSQKDLGKERVRTEFLTPDVVQQALMIKLIGAKNTGHVQDALHTGSTGDTSLYPESPETKTTPYSPEAGWQPSAREHILTVTGMKHVMAILEKMEDNLLGDVAILEPYACEGGCFGSPLLTEDHHLARFRWEQAPIAATRFEQKSPEIPSRRRPLAPRPGIRLDPDMGRAIQKLGELQNLIRSLPGRDCGACGAPTCAALAEDVVMEQATLDLCPYRETNTRRNEADETRGTGADS